MFNSVLTLIGGISIFLYGLKLIADGTQGLVLGVNTKSLTKFVKNPICGAFTGMTVAGITQSSVAVSFITVGLVDAGVISFTSSAPIIMGANVGTTVTAQLISLSGRSGVIIGSISSIIGLLASFSYVNRVKSFGQTSVGLGLVFAGLSIMDSSIVKLVVYGWFKNLFLIKSPIILFLNGLILTAVVQSSSAVTGIAVILANNGIVSFENAVFLTLGANVGSCFSVIIASGAKSLQAKRASVFNLSFNLLGAIMFFPILLLWSDEISKLFLSGIQNTGRAIANFHTIFNLASALIFMPFYRSLTSIIAKIVTDKQKESKSRSFHKTFTSKIRRFY